MKAYILVQNTDKQAFIEEVNANIEEGWQPHGGVSTCVREQQSRHEWESEYLVYTQAMVK